MSDKKRPAVGYVRMSSEQQQDSPARQRRDVRALADRRGSASSGGTKATD